MTKELNLMNVDNLKLSISKSNNANNNIYNINFAIYPNLKNNFDNLKKLRKYLRTQKDNLVNEFLNLQKDKKEITKDIVIKNLSFYKTYFKIHSFEINSFCNSNTNEIKLQTYKVYLNNLQVYTNKLKIKFSEIKVNELTQITEKLKYLNTISK